MLATVFSPRVTSNRKEIPVKRLTVLLALVSVAASVPARAAPHEVELTWMSIANWYFRFDNVRVIMDGYITRVPQSVFKPAPGFPADQFAFTSAAVPVNVPAVLRVRDALAADGRIDYLLAGHSHFDHTYDTPTWAAVTGAQMIGGLSTCLQAKAQGIPQSQCTVVSGSWTKGNTGERILLGNGVVMRVVRFNHSGNASNPFQHFARELSAPPVPDPVNGGWRAGVAEDYPNGGGGRAFLFTIDNPGGPISFFVNNSASAFDLDKDIVVNGVNYGSPLANLAGAMADAGIDHVDAWIGTGGRAVAQLIVPVLHPKVYIPNHWDGLFNSFEGGMPFPYADATLAAYLATAGKDGTPIALMPQHQYFDTYRLDANGVTMTPNHSVKQKLGFPDVQPFPAATTALVARAAATTVAPDDCDAQ
jgi:L-ascorbate metabolism protein UlaG (beta-lactamase superfamily)